jgi:hypothetical protein
MEEFKNTMDTLKKNFLLPSENILYNFFNYIITEIVNNYDVAYLFYILLDSKKDIGINKESILKISLLMNIYYFYFDIIYNLSFFLDNKITSGVASVHTVFSETITLLGLMFSLNYLIKTKLNIIKDTKIDKNYVFEEIYPYLNSISNILNDIENKDINIILDDNNEKKGILNNLRIKNKKKYLNVLIKYASILNEDIKTIDKYDDFVYEEITKNEIDFFKIKNKYSESLI